MDGDKGIEFLGKMKGWATGRETDWYKVHFQEGGGSTLKYKREDTATVCQKREEGTHVRKHCRWKTS